MVAAHAPSLLTTGISADCLNPPCRIIALGSGCAKGRRRKKIGRIFITNKNELQYDTSTRAFFSINLTPENASFILIM